MEREILKAINDVSKKVDEETLKLDEHYKERLHEVDLTNEDVLEIMSDQEYRLCCIEMGYDPFEE